MGDMRKPLDNVLDSLRDCSTIEEEKIGDQEMGVFNLVFNREKAKQVLQDYMSMVLVGRSG